MTGISHVRSFEKVGRKSKTIEKPTRKRETLGAIIDFQVSFNKCGQSIDFDVLRAVVNSRYCILNITIQNNPKK